MLRGDGFCVNVERYIVCHPSPTAWSNELNISGRRLPVGPISIVSLTRKSTTICLRKRVLGGVSWVIRILPCGVSADVGLACGHGKTVLLHRRVAG